MAPRPTKRRTKTFFILVRPPTPGLAWAAARAIWWPRRCRASKTWRAAPARLARGSRRPGRDRHHGAARPWAGGLLGGKHGTAPQVLGVIRAESLDVLHDLVHVVADGDELEVVGAYELMGEQLLPHPVEQPAPELGAHQDDGRGRHLARLHQRHHFEKLVQRAEAAGHGDVGRAVHEE